MFGTRLVQDRIRVVEMNEHLALNFNTSQQSQTFFNRNVSHLVRGLAAALNAQQLVITPEGAVEQKQVRTMDLCQQRIAETADGGNISESFYRGGFEEQHPDDCHPNEG